MTTTIGALPDLTPTSVQALSVEELDDARTAYPAAILAHRLEAADYIRVDTETARAHMGEAWRLSESLNVLADELSIRATVLKSIAAIAGATKEQNA